MPDGRESQSGKRSNLGKEAQENDQKHGERDKKNVHIASRVA
jgi:hypothetical protein